MRTPKDATAGKVECANCPWIGDASEGNDIADYSMRCEAGDTVPTCECPMCGCLAFPCGPRPPQTKTEALAHIDATLARIETLGGPEATRAVLASIPRRWPYTWTYTTGAWGHKKTADTITRAQFAALLEKWNRAGCGQWRYTEGHNPCA